MQQARQHPGVGMTEQQHPPGLQNHQQHAQQHPGAEGMAGQYFSPQRVQHQILQQQLHMQQQQQHQQRQGRNGGGNETKNGGNRGKKKELIMFSKTC